MIRLEKISVGLKNLTVLTELTVTFEEGICYGITGRNGSGKSLLFKTIVGFIPQKSGTVYFDDKMLKKGDFIKDTGVIIESPSFIANLTGLENLMLLADIQKKIDKKQVESTLALVGLLESKDKKFKHYSLGMKQRLRIAQAIMEDPKYYILDEPFNGLDEKGVKEIHQVIMDLKQKNKVILLTSHDDRDIATLCDKIYQIEEEGLHEIEITHT